MKFQHDAKLLINGELVAAEGGRVFDTINPATEDVIAQAPDASVADVERAIGGARAAFDEGTWATDPAFRSHCLHQFSKAMRDDLEELRALTVAEVGSPLSLTYSAQLDGPVAVLEYYADLAGIYQWTTDLGLAQTQMGMHRRWTEREPYGVVSAISAYNFPTQLNLAKLAPALAAGCTVVLKGAPDTPLITLALGRLIAEHTDIPAGVVSVLSSSEVATGAVMTTDPRVDMVSFTGSTQVGRTIMAASSPTLKKCFLELGGKSAFVVLDAESLPLSAMFCSFAVGAHSGQGCAITSRLVVPRALLDEAVDHVKATMAGLKVGNPSDPTNYMGPLINARQRDKVQGYVDGAIADGATVACGGGRPADLDKGFFFEPTLIVGADENSAIAQDEIFGPVMVLLPHDGDDDAVRIANNSIFGLSGAVNAADHDRAVAVGRRIRSGTMSINGGMYYSPDGPFGGYKQSGYGREMGTPGLEEFLQIKTFAEPGPK